MRPRSTAQGPLDTIADVGGRDSGWFPSWAGSWVRDSGLLVTSQIATAVLTSAAAIAIARDLGPSDWGAFSGLYGLSLGLMVVVDLGLATWLVRELSRTWAEAGAFSGSSAQETGKLLGGALALNAAIGCCLLFAVLLLSSRLGFGSDLSLPLVGLISYMVLSAMANGLEAAFRARRALRRVVWATLLEKGALLSLVLISVALGYGLGGIVLAYVFAGLLRLAFDGVGLTVGFGIRPSWPGLRTVRRFAVRSLPFALSAVSLNLLPRLDAFFLAMLSVTAAGYFALGDRALGPVLLVPAAASSTLYPFMARQAHSHRTAWGVAGTLGAAGALLATIGIVVAPRVVPLVFGQSYGDAVPIVRMMLFSLPFTFAASALMSELYSRGRERRVFIVTAATGIVGTAVIVGGQAIGGPVLAGLGYALRQALHAGGLAALYAASRGSRRGVHAGPLGRTGAVSSSVTEQSGE